jgi:hypothetical protein
MLLLGLALAVAEEWIIQQTSIAPFTAGHPYGRLWGVNWVYFLWALGYESVWVVLIPVQLVELLFPARREESWLRPRGLVITSLAFLLGARVAWYAWTQRGRAIVLHMPPYNPPPLLLLVGLASILLLILTAYALPSHPSRDNSHSTPRPWHVALILCLLGTPWAAFVLAGWGSSYIQGIPPALVLASALAWAALTFFLIRRWTSTSGWSDAHRFAVVFAGVLACTLGGFVVFIIGGALRIDWIGKTILDTAAIAWLLYLRRIHYRLPQKLCTTPPNL